MTLQGKIINLNNFKTGIIFDAVEDSCIGFEGPRDGKRGSEYSIYNYFTSRKNSRSVPLSYVIIKYTPSNKDSENRDVQIIYQ